MYDNLKISPARVYSALGARERADRSRSLRAALGRHEESFVKTFHDNNSFPRHIFKSSYVEALTIFLLY